MNLTTLYKLTDGNDCTQGPTQWGPGVTHKATKGKAKLCSNTVIHAYTHPLLAVLLNPIHGYFDLSTAHLWKAEGRVIATDHGLKVGCKSLTTLEQITVPVATTEQHIVFGILCVKAVCHDFGWNLWADRWLSRNNRTERAAWAGNAAAKAAWAAWAADIDLIAIAEEAMKY